MTRVILVRHGSHDRLNRILCGRMPGVSLSAQGRDEADRLAEALRGRGAAALLSSPQSRTRETAAPIAAALGLALSEEPGLDEIDFGDWTGRALPDLAGDPAWQAWNTHRADHRPPGGESMGEAQARALAALLARSEECLIAVSHGDVIRAVLLGILGLSVSAYDRLVVEPASISVVEFWPGGGRVCSVNGTAHLR